MSDTQTPRTIRSFVLRKGRMTKAQERALEVLWPQFGLDYSDQTIQPQAIFGRVAPLWLEIGFGNGDSLAEIARQHPDIDFIGIEVHTPGVGHLLLKIEEYELTNVRIYQHDAVEVLQNAIPDSALDRSLLFFPDPWHKKRHFKRRIVQPAFIALMARKLKADGVWHMATDWQDYAEWMVEHMAESQDFRNIGDQSPYATKPEYRPETKFERRGLKLGHGVWDILHQNNP